MSPNVSLGQILADPELRHINFFNGRLLTGEDLTAEQEANLAEGRHLSLALGTGVAYGLEVLQSTNSPSDVQVEIKAGLAVNPAGQTLRLPCDQIISLIRPPDPAAKADCVFLDCSPLAGSSTLSDDGFFLLTIAPASQREGLAPVNGLGNTLASCNSRYLTEGVQFRLLPLALGPIGDAARTRNEIAYQCFGLPIRTPSQFIADALFPTDAAPYGFETLVGSGRLTSQDVPLAVLQWSGDAGLVFVDRWAVRRRITRPGAARSAGYPGDYRRRTEAEAIFQQFQEHLDTIRQETGVPPTLAAEQRFKYLPPAALLPVGGANFDWKRFLGVHAPASETPLNSEQARALLWRSLREEPVAVVASNNALNSQPPPAGFHVFRLSSPSNLVLLARSTPNEIVAEDVYYDNSVCQLPGVQTVQAALDALCSAQNGCCTLVATPGIGWQKVFSQISPDRDASVCLPVGHYPLSEPVIIDGNGRGHLRLTGCGIGSRIAADKSEAALIFRNFASVTVSSLSAQSGMAGSKAALENLNGTFTFLDCVSVAVRQASFRCAPAGQVRAACLTVRNARPSDPAPASPATHARVEECELLIGSGQIGVLLINVGRSVVHDNVLRAEGKLAFAQLSQAGRGWQSVKRQLVSPVVAVGRAAGGRRTVGNAIINYNGQKLGILTHPGLVRSDPGDNAWQTAIDQLKPAGIDSQPKLADFISRLADQVLTTRGRMAGLPASTFAAVGKAITKAPATVAFAGIVIAGAAAPEVRVTSNRIDRVLAGIHIGVSEPDKARANRPLLAGLVTISGNRVQVALTAQITSQRHGIFIGNVASLEVHDNFVGCDRATGAEEITIEGIRIWGSVKRRILVRDNHLQGFKTVGILFNPLDSPVEPRPYWSFTGNLAEGARIPVQAPQAASLADNHS